MLGEFEFGDVGSCKKRKTGVPGEKNHRAKREPTTKSTHMWQRVVIEPSLHRWEPSALTVSLIHL